MQKSLVTTQSRLYILTPQEVKTALYNFIEDKENFCSDITNIKFYDEGGCLVTTHINTAVEEKK